MKTFARVCMMCFALFAGKVSYGVPWNEDDVRNEDMLAPTTYENVTLTFDGQAAAEGDAVAVFREGTDGTVFCGYGEVFQSKLEFTFYAAKDTALTLKVWRTGTPDTEVLTPTSITLDGENVDTLLAPNPGSTISGLLLAVVQSSPQTYTVTYNPGTNGAGAEQTDSKTKDVSLTLKDAIFTRTGYTQTGWATSDGGAKAYDLSGTYTANAAVTLYPFWTANSYTVTLDRQNGSGGTASVTATYDSAMPSITIPTRSGYTFGGYWTGTNGSGTQYYTATGTSARTWNMAIVTTLYAKWTANTYTVTYSPGAYGTGSQQTATKTHGVSLTLKGAIFTRTGYTQTGWATSDGGTQMYGLSGIYTANAAATLYPFWTANTYTITLDRQNGSGGTASVTATYGSAMPSITIPTRSGYTFGGYWSGTNGSGTQYYTATGASTRAWDKTTATTLYAKWTTNANPENEPIWTIENGVLTAVDLNGCTEVTIPDGVTRIGEGVFEDSKGLTSVTIPDSVTSIGDHAFEGCSGLTSMTIPNGVTSIGQYAFSHTRLTNITIPENVIDIGRAAFTGCAELLSITVTASNPAYSSLDGILLTKDGKTIIQGINGNVLIPDGVTTIGDNAFDGFSVLMSIIIPTSVTAIGNFAFNECIGLTEVIIPNSVVHIGEGAFSNCTGLKTIKLSTSLVKIEYCVFNECTGLTGVTIPNGVTSIGNAAFNGCRMLTDMTIPSSVRNLDAVAFARCTALTSINFEGNAPAATSSTFEKVSDDCTAYVKRGSTGWGVAIPGTWNGIRIEYAASGEYPIDKIKWNISADGVLTDIELNGVTDVVIPEGVTHIFPYVFEGLGITSVRFPSTLVTIGHYAFYECTSLTNVMFSSGSALELIDSWAFCFCKSLKGVFEVPEGVNTVEFGVFMGTGVEVLVLPSTLAYLGPQQTVFETPMREVYFKGNAPRLEQASSTYPDESSPYCDARSDLVSYVPFGSTGWKNSSVELPNAWPTYGGRTIRNYAGELPQGTSGSIGDVAVPYSMDDVEDITYSGKLDSTFKKAQTVTTALLDSGGFLVGTVQLKAGKINSRKGTVKLSAKATLIVNGKASSVTAKATNLNIWDYTTSHATLVFKKPIGSMMFSMNTDLALNGTFKLENASYKMVDMTIGGKWKRSTANVYVTQRGALPSGTITALLPDGEPVRAKGGKWAFDKAASIKYAKGVLSGYTDPKKPNLSAMKLTYTPKTGLFKGSFKLYALQGGKLKKYTVKVTGVVVDGEGTGVAKLAKPAATWDVSVR
ncbi:MAG: leucine-rich repeat protein [Kiritimatiellae bacterium]|nr:leucine-rich repeat protein [Kiritimatiellia bacterium]